MGIVNRAQKVMSSNFNALLSKFEEPGRDMAQLLNDMKEQILSAQRDLIKQMGECKRLETHAQGFAQEVERWEKRAELAIRQGDDALAREALSQKRRLLEEHKHQLATGVEQRQIAIAMKAEIERMKQKLTEYDQRKHITATQVTMSRSTNGVEGLGQTSTSRPFDDFRRLEEAIDHKEATNAAAAEVDDLLAKTALGSMTREEVDRRFQALEVTEAQALAEAQVVATPATSATPATPATPQSEEASSDDVPRKVRVRIEP